MELSVVLTRRRLQPTRGLAFPRGLLQPGPWGFGP